MLNNKTFLKLTSFHIHGTKSYPLYILFYIILYFVHIVHIFLFSFKITYNNYSIIVLCPIFYCRLTILLCMTKNQIHKLSFAKTLCYNNNYYNVIIINNNVPHTNLFY